MEKTEAINKHLPKHLQLTPHPGLEAALDQAAMNGWGPEELTTEALDRLPPNAGPGLLVRLLGQLGGYPYEEKPKPQTYGVPTHEYVPNDDLEGYCHACNLPTTNRRHRI
jgi:hypothetical protein